MPFPGFSFYKTGQAGEGGHEEGAAESGHKSLSFGSGNLAGKGAVELIEIPDKGPGENRDLLRLNT